MKTIKIDDDLYEHLRRNAQPFDDTPNTVLRRLLGLREDRDIEDANGRDPRDEHASVAAMRRAALMALEAALSRREGSPVRVRQEAAGSGGKRGPREQRFVTPRGQVVYLRTRSFDADKPPFFTMQPGTLADADWYVFACERRGDVVMSGDSLREMAGGLHVDGNGDFKPTFIVEGGRCAIYAHGGPQELPDALNAYDAVADSEAARPRD